MKVVVIFLIIGLGVAGFFGFSALINKGKEVKEPQEAPPQIQEEVSQTPKSAPLKTPLAEEKVTEPEISEPAPEPPKEKPTVPTVHTQHTQPVPWINTYIVSGPKDGETFEETNKVTFEFEAEISSEEATGKPYFEFRFVELNENWSSTTAKKIEKVLPAPKNYTFSVRARIQDFIDPTPAERSFSINVSPYFGKLKITATSLKTSSSPSLITLSSSLQQTEEINVTGWTIRGKRGTIFIPRGTEKYHPLLQSEEDIFIKYGDKIYIAGTLSPLGRGVNFRPNKCLGYLKNYHDFPISISSNCPKPTSKEISHLEPCCQQFILGLSRCEAPDYSQNLKVLFDTECTSYIKDNLNYGGCYKNYSQDSDFLEKKWHIYKESDIVIKECDTLYLRDKDNLLVDKYDYGRLYCK